MKVRLDSGTDGLELDLSGINATVLARIGRAAPVAVLPEGPLTIPYLT